jgi:hypothetical protein
MIRTDRTPQPITQAPLPNAEFAERMVPFDYTFQIKLEGKPLKTHRAKLTVSIEAAFNAVSIGYGVVPELTPVVFGPPTTSRAAASAPGAKGRNLRDIKLGELMTTLETSLGNSPDIPKDIPMLEAALLNGIRLNSRFSRLGLLDPNTLLDNDSLDKLFQVVSPPVRDVQFLYALFDDGSGREFQSAPLLNTAALGASDGKRPFRYFAQPISFAPLSTIRVEITELGDFRGELHISLQGYKALGGAGTPTASNSAAARRRSR